MTKTIYQQLLDAKVKEEKAKEKRIEIENEIIRLHEPQLKDNGQTTFDTDGFKITVKRSMNYKLDEDTYFKVITNIPEQYHAHKIKVELDKKKFNFLSELPDALGQNVYKRISNCVTMTPAKPSVSIEKK
jgi:hypothetical protein